MKQIKIENVKLENEINDTFNFQHFELWTEKHFDSNFVKMI